MRFSIAAVLMLAACATDAKGPEEDAPSEDGKEDSFAKPTDHGAIAFATPAGAKLAGSAGYHTWTFSLTGEAQIKAFTSRIPHEKTLDTVLYLYKKTASGTWGSYIARNDDTGSSPLSTIAKGLGAGDYRVLVKGYDASVKGNFGVEVDCTGAGCAPIPPPASGCVFGTFADDFRNGANPNLLRNVRTYTSAAQFIADNRGAVLTNEIIEAAREAGYTVTTVSDAFGEVDQSTIDIVSVYDLLGARAFTSIEFGSGDNPYGAIFDADGVKIAGLHDSDVTACTVTAATCELHQNFGDLRDDAAWAQTSTKIVTSAAALTGTAATNALRAIRVAYEDSADLAAGLANIDQGELTVRVLTNAALGKSVDVYDYGAGDNSYGAIFVANSATLGAEIHDGDFYRCSLLH